MRLETSEAAFAGTVQAPALTDADAAQPSQNFLHVSKPGAYGRGRGTALEQVCRMLYSMRYGALAQMDRATAF